MNSFKEESKESRSNDKVMTNDNSNDKVLTIVTTIVTTK